MEKELNVKIENFHTNIKTRSKYKHQEINYENHLNETLPFDHHRGDIASTSRLLGYSDTVMATCATFLVLPIRNLKKQVENQSLLDFLRSNYLELIEFFYGFLIILTIWENINIRAIVVKRVDDFILALIIFEMLATSVLPFTLELQAHYPDEKVSVLSTCAVLIFLQLIDIGIILYATYSPKLLHIDLKNWTKSELHELCLIMIFKPLISLILLLTAGAFCWVHYSISLVFIALLILMPIIRKLYWFFLRRMKKFERTEKGSFLENFSKGNISKERLENMSDNAIAIIACILIVDITVDNFPPKNDVSKNGLNYKLKHMTPEFLTFLATFCLVSALWYINHAVLHLIETVNSIMLYFQKIFLMFCCLCPLAGNMILRFATEINNDSVVSIRYSAIIVFISSISNFFIFLYGVLTGSKYFHDWASIKHFKKNRRQHFYALAKAVNVPFWSLICILGTLGSTSAAPYVLYVTFLAAFCSFFVSKIILMNHLGKAAAYIKKTIIRRKPFAIEKITESALKN
ncbi:endosomal/lysosomal proton channel TMEM175 [Hydra vulgaris]|uniref:endosomal/lysosomal proton channel TMEM175 n=1 Tax=Hydra vulgaris TaxID=6087 RepID=UPI0006411E64|nr:endosomal/lysosomal potassium channel TMEM175 [Hydra vulgaris]XP_047140256.1 endosomal/lysosomal potassium channel TMEM175 [Hydra vulgaris]